MLDSYPVNPSIIARKQSRFTKSWNNINPFIEYSRNLNKIFSVLRARRLVAKLVFPSTCNKK